MKLSNLELCNLNKIFILFYTANFEIISVAS